MSQAPDASARRGTLLTASLALVAFAVFLLILGLARIDSGSTEPAGGQPDPAEAWKLTSEGRKSRLAEVRAKSQSAATTYGWVDQNAGVVRLPIERAMELSVAELKAKQARE